MDVTDSATTLEAAAEHQQAGRFAEAEALLRGLLKAEPNHAEALHRYGCLALQAGWGDIAVRPLERAVALAGSVAAYRISLGRARLQLRQPDQALEAFRAAAALDPNLAAAHFFAGFVLAEQGRSAEARAAYEAAIAAEPGFIQALFNLGALLQAEGDLAGAAARYRAALAVAPEFTEALLNLGICLANQGEAKAAIPHLERAAALQPNQFEIHDALANALVGADRAERAIESYRRAIALNRRSGQVRFNLGNAFRKLDRLEAALMAYGEAIKIEPGLVRAIVNAGEVSLELGRAAEAERYFRQALAREPGSAQAETGLARALRQQADLDGALAAAGRAIALDGGLPEAHSVQGVCLQDLGRFDEATAAFRRALAIDPDFSTALYHLANMGGGVMDDVELERMVALVGRPRLERETRIGLNFALGKALDARADYDRAFGYFEEANALKAAVQPYDHAITVRQVERLVAVFDRAFFEARRGTGADSSRPIFVLGMPRSGTTLVEQILASHPQVHGGGELSPIAAVLDALGRLPQVAAAREPYPLSVRRLDAAAAGQLAQLYLERLGRDAGDASHVTDKAPANFVHLGLIALLLPEARIIHCRRDPFDTCLSCYFQSFLEPMPYTNGLDRIGLYYREYERLMDHWRRVLPSAMLDVPYEALVAEPEPWTRRILDHCGLPWDDAALRFFATERAVQSASYWQVRQPIYQSSVQRWRHYRRHLGPLFEALGRQPEVDGDAA